MYGSLGLSLRASLKSISAWFHLFNLSYAIPLEYNTGHFSITISLLITLVYKLIDALYSLLFLYLSASNNLTSQLFGKLLDIFSNSLIKSSLSLNFS